MNADRLRSFVPVGLGLALAGAASWFFRYPDAVSDLWWHLASGREIVARMAVPVVDSFRIPSPAARGSTTSGSGRFVYWSAYRLHPEAVAWLNIFVLLLLFGVLYRTAKSTSNSRWAAGATTWLVAAAAYWFLDIRPAPDDAAVGRNRNADPGKELGALPLATARRRLDQPSRWLRLWRRCDRPARVDPHSGALAPREALRARPARGAQRRVLPCRLDRQPVRLATDRVPVGYLKETAYRSLNEWQSTPLGFDLATFEGRFWLVFLFAGVGAALSVRREPYLVALSLVTAIMSIGTRRFIPLFLVTSVPLVAVAIALPLRQVAQRLAPPIRRRLEVTATVVTLILLPFLWHDVRIGPNLLQRWTSFHSNPRAAVRYLREIGPPRRVLNHYSWGGYLLFAGGGAKVFIDERANTIYDDAIYLDYVAIVGGAPDAGQRIADRSPEIAIVPRAGIARTLANLDPPWRPIYADARAMILVPPGSPLLRRKLPDPRRVLGDEPDQLLAQAGALRQRGDVGDARKLIESAIALDPLMLRGYAALAMLQAAEGEVASIRATIESGIRASPRHRLKLRPDRGAGLPRGGRS